MGSKSKTPKSIRTVEGKRPKATANASFLSKNPSWRFCLRDKENWPFTKDHAGELFWSEILPALEAFEMQTWESIKYRSNDKHHDIELSHISAQARKVLGGLNFEKRSIEIGSIFSLRLNGTHRLYGFIQDGVFSIVWFDDDHGDNDTCVYPSRKKHT